MSELAEVVASSPDLEMKATQRAATSQDTSTSSPTTPYSATVEVVSYTVTGADQLPQGPLKLLLSFGEHAREFISSETGLHLLRLLADPAVLEAQASRQFSASELLEIQRLLRCCVQFQILPIANHGGRALVEQRGQMCERKNGNGVDLNRNWAVDWGKKEADYAAFEEMPGARAFSEPEAQIVKELAEAFQPHVWLTVHSGMEGLFMPYDHRHSVANNTVEDVSTLAMLHALNEHACDKRCTVGSGGASVGYLAHGTATDYMYERLHIPIAMTWEIFGDLKADSRDCFRMFNPLTRDAYQETVTRWSNAVLRTVLLAAQHPALRHLAQQAEPRSDAGISSSDTREGTVRHAAADEMHWQPHDSMHELSLRDVNQVGGRGGVHTTGITQHGVRQMLPREMYRPGRNLMWAIGLFGVTVVLWCAARRFMTSARTRKRIGEAVGASGGSDRHD